MKKEDLIALGIDEETAKSVMALHGKTVTQLNAKVATAESERDSAKQELQANQAELDTLKGAAKGNEDLEAKLTELQTKFDASKATADAQLAAQQKDFAIMLELKDADIVDAEIVSGLLDKETIKVTDKGLQGLKEQLDTLKESKGFLFQTEDPSDPTRPFVSGGNAKGGTGNGQTDPFKAAVQKYT